MAAEKGINIIDYDNLSNGEKVHFDAKSILQYETPYGTLYFYKRKTEVDKEMQKARDFERRLNQIRTKDKVVITASQYEKLPLDLKNGYVWDRRLIGDQRDYTFEYTKGISRQELERQKNERLNQIRTKDNVVISANEYENLPSDLKNGYVWDREYLGDQRDYEVVYKKGITKTELLRRKHERYAQIRTNPDVILSPYEYENLPKEFKDMFEWKRFTTGHQFDYEIHWRKKNQKDYEMERQQELLIEQNRLFSVAGSHRKTDEKNTPITYSGDYGRTETIYFTPSNARKYVQLGNEINLLGK